MGRFWAVVRDAVLIVAVGAVVALGAVATYTVLAKAAAAGYEGGEIKGN